MIGNGTPVNPFGAIPTVSLADAKVFEQITFMVRSRIPLAISGVANLVFDPSAFTGRNIVNLPIGFDAIGGPIHVDIYLGVTANNDGTLIPIVNHDFASITTVAKSIIRLNPTGINIAGLTPIELLIPSDGNGAAGVSGASSSDPLVTNLSLTDKILLRLTSLDTTKTSTVGFKFDFFEVP